MMIVEYSMLLIGLNMIEKRESLYMIPNTGITHLKLTFRPY